MWVVQYNGQTPLLDAPLMAHRHLTERAGRELTKAAIEDVITRGEIDAWCGLVKAIREDQTGRIARRAREVAKAMSRHDARALAFAALLPHFEGKVREGQCRSLAAAIVSPPAD